MSRRALRLQAAFHALLLLWGFVGFMKYVLPTAGFAYYCWQLQRMVGAYCTPPSLPTLVVVSITIAANLVSAYFVWHFARRWRRLA